MALLKRSCSREKCERPHLARGLCDSHYRMARRKGTLPGSWEPPIRETREQVLWARVAKSETGCWEWTGPISTEGYGICARFGYAHRVSFEVASGRRIKGVAVDHICHNRRCVRPDHLRAVTPKQNSENHSGPTSASTSGERGVYFSKQHKRWVVQVTHHGRRYSGGTHARLEDAAEAAVALRNRLFTHNDMDRARA